MGRAKSIKIIKGRNGRADKIELIVNLDLVKKIFAEEGKLFKTYFRTNFFSLRRKYAM